MTRAIDEATFLILVSKHQGIIHKICRLYRDTPEDREDLFQEIVFEMWKSAPGFRGDAGFGTWLYRIALNTAIASFRKKKPDIRYPGDLPDTPEEPPPFSEQHEQLWWAMKQLSDAEKAFMTLYLEDLSHREIADIIGTTENNVAVKLSRIREKIQQLLNLK